MLLRRQLRVVLHQIQSPENLGAVARLVANFDVALLRLSDPQVEDIDAAHRTAVHAGHVLAAAERMSRLEDAVADAVYVLGTSGRDALRGRVPVTPEVGVERLRAAAARGPVALVLGGERRGLSDEELALCQDVACIPAPGPQPSLNLAQAAAVLLYLASREEELPAPAVAADPGAPQALREVLRRRMERALHAADGLNPQSPLPILDEMLRALDRAQLSRREAELWAAAWKQLARAAGAPGD
ncbi:MAG TPA: RNA methyltransferase [Myxococcaceae bacterium]|nr:RNA methyltransferase [Myxococcaceae bacterium]